MKLIELSTSKGHIFSNTERFVDFNFETYELSQEIRKAITINVGNREWVIDWRSKRKKPEGTQHENRESNYG